MARLPDSALERRALVLAPTGRDALLTRDVLTNAGIPAHACRDMEEVHGRLEEGAGTLFIAEEALTAAGMRTLSRALRAQPPWSDVPIILSTGAGETSESRVRAVNALDPSGNVTILERPIRVFTMVVTVQAMLRARRRQYQIRDLLMQQQAQMERLQAERELRARFVSLLAHDLRGPVSAATLATEMIIRNPGRLDERRETGVKLKRNLERVEQMVRDLLDASRIQAGQPLHLRLEECDLAEIARDVVEELNPSHGDRLQLLARQEVRGVWSAEELRRAVWNLATNAAKYGAPGTPITVEVSLADDLATLSVHNDGNPISAEDQRRVFEPFARTRAAETGSQLGWGLGLTLVRGCLDAHGGNVRLESSAGAGTTFTLELPLDARPFQELQEPPTEPQVPLEPLGRKSAG